ncbi:MAG: hypothetical protein A2142_04135 [candidate division Zixibacteria bacterium RBG_16_48_11]|nr:MAG: hypothetical protein A2142_04135 [candidate division Zixibacteria bacterium RBG_16_48_11]
MILSLGNKISPYDLGLEQEASGKKLTLQQVREQAESKHIQEALSRHKGNISSTAKDLGVSRTTFYDILEKYKIKKEPG